MKILSLPAYFDPEITASSHLSKHRYQAFVDAGFEVLIYTPMPTRGISRDVRKECCKREQRCEGRMKVLRFSLMTEGKNPILRALRYTLQCMKQFCFGEFSKEARDCDVILVASTPPIQGAMAALVKKFTKKPIVYNLQDIFPDSLVGTGLAKKDGLLWKIGRVIEDFTYRNVDKIIVISQDFKRNIMAKGVPEEKIEVIYNWVDEKTVVPVQKLDNPLFEEFGIDKEKFTVVYAGNLGNAQNIDIIMDAANKLKSNADIQFVLFGTGGFESDIRRRIKQDNICNLKLFPLQPYERVPFVYGLGDACIVSCKPGLGGAAMPSKTWSIMSCGRAVIANFDEGELKTIIEQNNCGIFTKAGDLNELVSAITNLSNNRELCAEMGHSGRQFILDNLTREVGTKRYVEVVKKVLR